MSHTLTHRTEQCLWISSGTRCQAAFVPVKASRPTQRESVWCLWLRNKMDSVQSAAALPPLHHHSLTPPSPPLQSPSLQSDLTHLPRVCPFQQRSSFVTSAAIFSSLQMVCGRDTQKPRMGLSRSFSSVTCTEAERNWLWLRPGFKVSLFGMAGWLAGWGKHIEAAVLTPGEVREWHDTVSGSVLRPHVFHVL